MEHVIEVATPADANDLMQLVAELYRAEAIELQPAAMDAALQRLLREPALGLVLLARDRGASSVVGYAIATLGYDVEFVGHDAFITDLYVVPEARSQGLGQHLLDAAERMLAQRQVRAVHLMVRPENARARALYEARGFSVVPRLMMTKQLA